MFSRKKGHWLRLARSVFSACEGRKIKPLTLSLSSASSRFALRSRVVKAHWLGACFRSWPLSTFSWAFHPTSVSWTLFIEYHLRDLPFCTFPGYSLNQLLFLFLDTGEGREWGKGTSVCASGMPPAGDLACNPGIRPDWELNQQLNALSHTGQGSTHFLTLKFMHIITV